MLAQFPGAGQEIFLAAGHQAVVDAVQIRACGVDDAHIDCWVQGIAQAWIVILGRVQGIEGANAQGVCHARDVLLPDQISD